MVKSNQSQGQLKRHTIILAAEIERVRDVRIEGEIARGSRNPTVRQQRWLHNIVDRLRGAA